MKNILVFFGGVSQEHDISIITGVFTLNSLDKEKFNAVPVYISRDGEWYSGEALKRVDFFKNFDKKQVEKVTLTAGNPTLMRFKGKKLVEKCLALTAINCLHGRNGEDGSLFGALRLSKIALASPDMFCSSMSMDKALAKICLKAVDIPTVKGETVMRKAFFKERESVIKAVVDSLSFPIIVKPVSSGSSIGIKTAKDYRELEVALEEAFRFDERALCEQLLADFFDINCAAYRKRNNEVVVSMCEKPVTAHEILTFRDKYTGVKGGIEKEFPAKIPAKIASKIQNYTSKIYNCFNFDGIVRIDYLTDGKTVYLNEINSVPGSLAYYLFCENLNEFKELLTEVLEQCFSKSLSYNSSCFEYPSEILKGNFKSIKK